MNHRTNIAHLVRIDRPDNPLTYEPTLTEWADYDPNGTEAHAIAVADSKFLNTLETKQLINLFADRYQKVTDRVSGVTSQSGDAVVDRFDPDTRAGWEIGQVMLPGIHRCFYALRDRMGYDENDTAIIWSVAPITDMYAAANDLAVEYNALALEKANQRVARWSVVRGACVAFMAAGAVAATLLLAIGGVMAGAWLAANGLVGASLTAGGSIVAAGVTGAASIGRGVIQATGAVAGGALAGAGSLSAGVASLLGQGFRPFNSGFATLGPSASSAPILSQFVNADIPNVVSQAFQSAGAPPVVFRDVAKRARFHAKRARKIILNNRADRRTAVASFGDTELSLHTNKTTSTMDDAALEGMLFDYFLANSAFRMEPGSLDSYMCADQLKLPICQDASLHRMMRMKFDDPEDDWYWEEYNYEYEPDPEPEVCTFPLFEEEDEEEDEWTGLDVTEWTPYSEDDPWYSQSGFGITEAPSVPNHRTYFGSGEAEPEEAGSSWDFGSIIKGVRNVVDIVREVKELTGGGDAPAPPKSQPWAATKTAAFKTAFGEPLGAFAWLNNRIVAVPVFTTNPAYKAKAMEILAQFLNDPKLVPRTNAEYPFFTPPMGKAGQIVRLQDRSVGIGSTRSNARHAYLSNKPAYQLTSKSLKDSHCGSIFDRTNGSPVEGEFFRSGLLVAKLVDLPSRTYGQINVATMPFEIDINRNYVDSRAKVSFVHETLHAITEMLKLGLSHQELHALSVFITSEVLPGYLALEKKLSSTSNP